ncbi:MAG: hypothetical protein NTX92_08400, partial [Euryarchaeota archaeon]|nr:hypothetical protein [Euryarchaeota archaeon]
DARKNYRLGVHLSGKRRELLSGNFITGAMDGRDNTMILNAKEIRWDTMPQDRILWIMEQHWYSLAQH